MHAPLVAPTIAQYRIKRAQTKPPLSGDAEHRAWRGAHAAAISHFHVRSSAHRPRTVARLLYDDQRVYGLFCVEDRYVRCTQTEFQSPVCIDSCVEFFVQPVEGKGYFNFEFNAGGALMVLYIEDATVVDGEFRKFTPVKRDDVEAVEIYTTLPRIIEPEWCEPINWRLGFSIPFDFFERYLGVPVATEPGETWRGNFYKCGDQTSHPHWASWSPIDGKLSFHQPRFFGTLRFE